MQNKSKKFIFREKHKQQPALKRDTEKDALEFWKSARDLHQVLREKMAEGKRYASCLNEVETSKLKIIDCFRSKETN